MTARRAGDWPRLMALAILVIAPLLLGLRVAATGVSVDTDIQSILPRGAADGAEIAAIRRAAAAVAARITIGVRGGERSQRSAAAARLEDHLAKTGLFAPAADDLAETIAWLRANRYELTCAASPDRMTAAWGDGVARQARTLLFSGVVPLSGADLAADPFMLDFAHATCLAPGGAPTGDDALVSGRLIASPYALETQSLTNQALDDWRADPRHEGLSLARAGAVFFAAAAGGQAKREITIVGGVSIALILLLYTTAFRTPATAGIALATVAAGALGGAWLCFVVFGAVHFSVFVFGSALTGISADYAVHSLAARRALGGAHGWAHGVSQSDAPPGLRRALTISMLTSTAGFAALLAFGIDVFRQIGVFSIGGLAFAWLFAVVALPWLDRPAAKAHRPALIYVSSALERTARRRTVVIFGALIVAVVAALGATQTIFIDDVRRFQSLSPDLLSEQATLSDAGDSQFSTSFLLSSGETEDAAREAEEAYLAATDANTGYLALSRFDPSQARRAEIRDGYETHLLGPHLASLQSELGLTNDPPQTGAPPAPRPAWLTALEFEHDGRAYLLAPMLTDTSPGTGADGRVIDPAATYGAALAEYRRTALRLLGLAAVAAALFLGAAYRTPRALWLIAPPLMGCAVAVAIPALLGFPATLFSVLALFVVLGAGIDFSVFQWEMRRDETGWTGAAVLIAALSTCAAMGMLGFSATLPVQSFGITIAVGVLGGMIFSFAAPLAAEKDS